MKTGSVARCAQSGAISTALIGLAGFVSGALVVALLAFTRHPAPGADQAARLPASASVLHDARPTSTPLDDSRQWPIVGEPFKSWPFESAPPAPKGAPGSNRPDRLSAPEGWTYDRDQAKRSD